VKAVADEHWHENSFKNFRQENAAPPAVSSDLEALTQPSPKPKDQKIALGDV
jgi:hypothetical protein